MDCAIYNSLFSSISCFVLLYQCCSVLTQSLLPLFLCAGTLPPQFQFSLYEKFPLVTLFSPYLEGEESFCCIFVALSLFML